MGRSSRPHFSATTPSEAEHFLINPVEKCRIVLGIDKMVLVGHSFGAYISGCYTERFPNRVSKLVLISCVGVARAPDKGTPPELVNIQDSETGWGTRLLKYLMRRGVTPPSILRRLGRFGKGLCRRYMKRKWRNLSEEELHPLEFYAEQVLLYHGSGEYAINLLLDERDFGVKPLYNRVVNTPTVFIFGENDWVDRSGFDMVAKRNSSEVVCEIISASEHHMYMDNPNELVSKMVSALNRI